MRRGGKHLGGGGRNGHSINMYRRPAVILSATEVWSENSWSGSVDTSASPANQKQQDVKLLTQLKEESQRLAWQLLLWLLLFLIQRFSLWYRDLCVYIDCYQFVGQIFECAAWHNNRRRNQKRPFPYII